MIFIGDIQCSVQFSVAWKDCHKSFSNPFDGGLECVFEKVVKKSTIFHIFIAKDV